MADPDRTERFLDQVLALAKAYALCGARDEAAAIRNDVRLFTDVRAAILKIQNPDSGRGGSGAVEIDTAIGQLVNEAVAADEVVDIYKLAGVETPELSILSDEFLDCLADKDKPNLQIGLLRRLLNDQIKTVQRTNVVQARRFSEQLDEAINRYTNRSLTTAEIIAELVKLAKEMRDQASRHEQLGLSRSRSRLLRRHRPERRPPCWRWATTRSRRSPSTSSGPSATAPPSTGTQGVSQGRHALQGAPPAGQVRLPARPRGKGGRARP